MARRDEELELLTIRETCSLLKVDDLKALLALFRGTVLTRKADLVAQLAGLMENPQEVAAVYEHLDDLAKKAVQETARDPRGVWHRERFRAKYGQLPPLDKGEGLYGYRSKPTHLRLFFPRGDVLPTDLRAMLLGFVPAPPPLKVGGADDLPAKIRLPHVHISRYHEPDPEEVELRVRHTERAALLDVKAVLRLIDRGSVKVGEKTRRPSQATLEAIAGVLSEGDFYQDDDRGEWKEDPAWDLTMKPFAWPMLLQAAGLAGTSGAKLQLSAAGREATTRPAHEVIQQTWNRWLKTTLLDEFNRVDVIKGQSSKGALTAVAPRRQAIVEVLKECPTGKWLRVEELFRLSKASAHRFSVSHDKWRLYLYEQQYGSFGFNAKFPWEGLEGRFTLAFLFEYAATLGLIDVAYVTPDGARNDFYDRWGTDDLSCLSRYDGLMFFRINPLGEWCLGLAGIYEPREPVADRVLKMLPNLDVVAADKPLSPADVLLLDRFAERKSEAVWHLDRDRILTAVEQGLTVKELKEFLASRIEGEMPQNAETFLTDVENKAGQLEDLGAARLIACADAVVAHTLVNDRRLRNVCQLAGERHLVFRPTDEAAVRRALKELGHVLPPPR